MQRGRSRTCVWRPKMLLLETEDACSVDDDYCLLLPLVFLPWSLVCAFLFLFLCFVCSVFLGLIVAGCLWVVLFLGWLLLGLWVALFLGPLGVYVLWFSCSGSALPSFFFSLGVLLPFINPADCPPSVLPLQDCYLPRTRSWARDVVLNWIESVADFPACWIGMEKTNTIVLPAAATFRQQWISPATTTFQAANGHFYFDPWTVGNSAIGP